MCKKNQNLTSQKTGTFSSLSGKLYLLILIGLSVAALLMLAGFGLNFTGSPSQDLSLENLQEINLKPGDLIQALKNNQMPAGLLVSYIGLFMMILVPISGLIFIIGYYSYSKKRALALTAAGVLFILIMSALIGLLKS